MKGVYQQWAIAKQHIDGKNVRHKAYPTLEEAKITYIVVYKEMTKLEGIQKQPSMEVKKKVSVDTILSLERLRKKTRLLTISSANGNG
jgi:hypothetical protein